MKSLRLIISAVAIGDLTDIWTYIAEDSPHSADSFIDKIHEKCLTISESPYIGRQRDELSPGIRSFPIGRYVVFYRIEPDAVEIVRILSGYRDIDALFNQ